MELFLINPKSLPLEDKMKIAGALPDQLSISDIAKICYPDDLNARNLLSKEIIALCKSKELPYYGDINGWEWGSVLYDDSMINIGLSKNPFPEIIGAPITSGDSMRDLRFNGNKFRANAGNCLINKCDFKKYLDGKTLLPIGNLLNWFNDAEQQSEIVVDGSCMGAETKEPNNLLADAGIGSEDTAKVYQRYKESLDALNIDLKSLSVKNIFNQVSLTNKALWSITFATFQRDVWPTYSKEKNLKKRPGRPRKK